ncbi:ATP-binding protein [Trinickia caryophylli]|uniref:Histidine kinase-, DNA gyrase B-, and HSP90-like ATPase n=1 Tax=Trinickia caryophylli TaxID=28094 RepID=A0A1X7FID5_TRICW|nr:ATP-binding protein [Trinickia caryophylli]PMS13245.1 histidine kinase [Trinickia caryophylli]TRX19230.1 histidine kinase [Trinickia caryophylli]WQE13471.1 histidine kinase [Trinickia caryophylli]SMF52294.1 Histidine kinase-, DNA gyrase B-, and HSP90-like ATPase [Trinickia caryophylli]GLU34002.1 hypothetical protein Busp01_38440 [Trinickia caryophylli]
MDTPMIVPRDSRDSRGRPGAGGELAAHPEMQQLRHRLRELAHELVIACEATRTHIARELHDSVGSELIAARFALANAVSRHDASPPADGTEAFAVAQHALDAACEASRRLVADLHAPHFDGGVVAALSQWTRAFSERTGLRTSLVCDADVRLTQLPPGAALAVFRVAQEALTNVAKHAGASCADVRIETDARHLTLIVSDDGRGLPRRRAHAGFGLASMRARCEAFEGSLRVARRRASAGPGAGGSDGGTARGAGTIVRARFGWEALQSARTDTPPTTASAR